jgi:hypothetical protein
MGARVVLQQHCAWWAIWVKRRLDRVRAKMRRAQSAWLDREAVRNKAKRWPVAEPWGASPEGDQ